MREFKAVIAGITGAVGSAIGRELVRGDAGPVVGLSRGSARQPIAGVTYLQADLSDATATRQALAAHQDATHLYYCGRAAHQEQTLENEAGNRLLLANLLDAFDRDRLDHVHLVQGGKVYGVHIGPFPTPARESDPRAPIENFNYVQEDLLRERSADAPWSWSASRPNTLVHFSPAIARNLVSSLGAYAAICRELGAAFDYPGPEAACRSLTQVTCIELLARAMHWMSTEPACANEAFNVTNGDAFRWEQVWPQIAAHFDMPCGSVRPMRLAEVMKNRNSTWQAIVQRHDLLPLALDEVANWGYLDATLERTWDEVLSTNKMRSFGFHEWADSESAIGDLLEQYRTARILP